MSKNAKRRLAALRAEPRGAPGGRLPPKKRMTAERRLRRMITGLLGGPRGDPDPHHRLAAAHACLLLRELGHGPHEEVERELRSGEVDYVDLAERDAVL